MLIYLTLLQHRKSGIQINEVRLSTTKTKRIIESSLVDEYIKTGHSYLQDEDSFPESRKSYSSIKINAFNNRHRSKSQINMSRNFVISRTLGKEKQPKIAVIDEKDFVRNKKFDPQQQNGILFDSLSETESQNKTPDHKDQDNKYLNESVS